MQRLTKHLEDGQAVMDCQTCKESWASSSKSVCTALYCRNRLKDRLAAYEDTGLEPAEIVKLRSATVNGVTLHIENCLDCPRCYTDRIYTADSFEHEEGAYCMAVEDTSRDGFGKNGKHKLIGSDDWHLRNYTKVPDWCPLRRIFHESNQAIQ